MADIKALAEELVNLTVKEVKELADILKDDEVDISKVEVYCQVCHSDHHFVDCRHQCSNRRYPEGCSRYDQEAGRCEGCEGPRKPRSERVEGTR